ncbi:MAG: acyl-CoA thioesterase [Planctomycetota bacterium]|nr:MAG: acyl-CoA thioesterase [Planctomycetota bacterium]
MPAEREPALVRRLAQTGGVVTSASTTAVTAPIDRHEITIRVRYAEVDAMGVLHHARYLVYFEMGRTELLRANGLAYAEMERRGLYYVVARLEVRYKAPARYDDVLTLKTRTTRFTPVRVDHAYELERDGRLLAEASSTLALVNAAGEVTPLPEQWRSLLMGSSEY